MNDVHKRIAEYVRDNPDTRIKDLADSLGISVQWLNRILRAHGVDRNPRLKNRADLLAKLDANESPDSISGCSISKVQYVAKEHGLTRRNAQEDKSEQHG